MAAVSLIWNTNTANVTLSDNALFPERQAWFLQLCQADTEDFPGCPLGFTVQRKRYVAEFVFRSRRLYHADTTLADTIGLRLWCSEREINLKFDNNRNFFV